MNAIVLVAFKLLFGNGIVVWSTDFWVYVPVSIFSIGFLS